MKKNSVFAALFVPMSLFAGNALAQQTNSNEDYSAYLPEVRAINSLLAHIPQGGSLLTREGLEAVRKGVPDTSAPPPTAVKYISGGRFAIRIFKPDTIHAVVLSIHGGGWAIGAAEGDDAFNDHLARTCKVAVVSVDYRLAPENPFPTCIDDCKAAAKWLVENSRREFGTDKLFVSGYSAGGQLAAEITLYIRDSLHAIDRVKGVNLMYGCFDLSRTPSLRMVTDSTLMVPKKFIEEIFELVFPGWTNEKLQDPKFSPLFADLRNLPPALFTIGTADPLINDSYFMEARWRLAGNRTYLATYPECSHAFNYFPTAMAAAANKKMCDWIISLCTR